MRDFIIGVVVALVLVYLARNKLHDAIYGPMVPAGQGQPVASPPNCPEVVCPQIACPQIECPIPRPQACPMIKCAAPQPCKAMNAKWYLDRYTDLKNAFGSDYSAAVHHFFRYGYGEGRFVSPEHEASGLSYANFAGGLEC